MKNPNPFLQRGCDPAAAARDAEFIELPNGPPEEKKAAPSPKAEDGANDAKQDRIREAKRKAEIRAATAPGEVESQQEIEALALLCQHGIPALGEVGISSAMFSTPAQRTLWRAMENSARKTPDGKPDMPEVMQATLTASLPADITKDEITSLVTSAFAAAPNPAHAATTLGRVASAYRRRERIGKLEQLKRIETGETSGDAQTLLEELNALHGPPGGKGVAPVPDAHADSRLVAVRHHRSAGMSAVSKYLAAIGRRGGEAGKGSAAKAASAKNANAARWAKHRKAKGVAAKSN